MAMLAGFIVALGALAFAGVALIETRHPSTDVEWQVFWVIATLLLLTESTPAAWVRYQQVGIVTPFWMFAYALMLLGSPTSAVVVALSAITVRALAQSERPVETALRVGCASLSLSTVALALYGLGADGPITTFNSAPWTSMAAIIVAGLAMLLVNTIVVGLATAVERRQRLVVVFRRGIGVRTTANGTLVSLAPLWAIGVDFNWMMIPLLAITSLLVLRSAQQALQGSYDSTQDSLTGLSNQRALLDHLDEHLGDSRAVGTTLLLMDLNGFKEINDRLGHQMGDSLLVAFAERLLAIVPADSFVARLGGDEFAVLMPFTVDRFAVTESAAAIYQELTAPLDVHGFPVTIGVSIGVATAPQDGHTPADLLRASDVAMYRAKRTKCAVEFYDNCVRSPQHGRVSLLGDLPAALANHQLYVHYQPQIRMDDHSVDTIEALVRWQHPVLGLIPPDEFIGLAEQTDLIGPLTELVLRAATVPMRLAGRLDMNLAVNVSAKSLQQAEFADHVLGILADTDFPATRLELEVTERALVTNVERTNYTIAQLRAAGVRIAIDDFGVGYSSYQTLQRLEVDRVKIDREFIGNLATQPRDRLIVSSLIRLAHDLGLDVVAEGIETSQIWDAVSSLGCDVGQGYGIAMPMSYPDLRSWLTQWAAVTPTLPVAERV